MRVRILFVVRRLLAICVFATAAAAATAAGSGVIVVPHVDPPGTPLFHTHGPAAYRLPLLFDVPRLPVERGARMTDESIFDLSVTLVLALLAFAVPHLSRPTLRAVGELVPIRLARARGHRASVHGPPRTTLQA